MYAVMGLPANQVVNANVDHVKDVLGAGSMASTAERKLKEKQQRLAYGNQLQQQMQQQQEAKKRERMERMGISPNNSSGGGGPPPPGMLQAPSAQPSYSVQTVYSQPPAPPAYAPPQPPAPAAAISAAYAPPQPYAPPSLYQPPQPAVNFMPQAAPQQQPPPAFSHGYLHAAPGYAAASPPLPMAQPIQMGAQQPGFGPPSPTSHSPPGSFGGFGAQPPPAPALFGSPPRESLGPLGLGQSPGAGNLANIGNGQRAAERAHKEQYRLELEAQMRAKEERKRMEKEASLNAARARQAALVAQDYANAMGRMGPGSVGPGMGVGIGMGQDLNLPRGYQQARDREQMMMGGGGHGGGGMGMPGVGAMPMGFGGMQQAPPPPLMMGGSPGPMMGGPGSPTGGPLMGPQAPMGPGPGMAPGPGAGPGFEVVNPNFRFRSDNAYLTPAELDVKARQRAELQEALERQIAEKKYRKDMEAAARKEEMMREDQRLKMEQDRLRTQYEQERNRENNKDGDSTEDKVAAAWARAKAESEELRKNKYGERRAAGLRASQEFAESQPQQPAGADSGAQAGHLVHQYSGRAGDMTYVPAQQLVMAAPSTPVLAEKVKQLAAQEIQKVRADFQAEAASLRTVVQEQSAQVAALKHHAERMEQQAETAQAKVAQMRVDLIRSSMAAPESLLHMLSDYPMQPRGPPPPAMLDIALDLPPPAAVQRRSLAPQPVYDMGPLIPPVHNPHEADTQLQRDFLATPLQDKRPPTQGLRTINPLESSLAAESVFIYPNGRELPRSTLQAQAVSAATHARSDLPFKSLVMSPGRMQAMADTSLSQGYGTLPGGAGGLTQSLGASGGQLQGSSVMMSPARVQAALAASTELHQGGSVPVRHVDGDVFDTGPIPPATADAVKRLQSQLRQEADAAAAAAATASTPLDVETLMQKNKDKLNLLEELSALSTTDNTAAIDAFLSKFSRTRPGLPERTRTPVLRVNTPTKASTTTYSVGTYHSSFPTATSQITGAPYQPTASGQNAPRSPIRFTDNMRSAAPSITGEGSRHNSKPGTPTVGDYLDPEALKARDMQTLPRAPSYGRRAGSAGSTQGAAGQVPPSPAKPPLAPASTSSPQVPVSASGEDTLDVEMRQGLGSQPSSGVAGKAGSRPASGQQHQLAGLLPRIPSRPNSGSQPRDGSLSGMPIPAPSLSRQTSLNRAQ